MSDLREVLRAIEVFQGELPVFDLEQLPSDPHELFTEWLLHAIEEEVREPHAMTVSTAGLDGNPSARVLICKNVCANGWQFAADAHSRKGRELAACPTAALTFYWSPLARQVRIAGTVRAGRPRGVGRRLPGPLPRCPGRGAARPAEHAAAGPGHPRRRRHGPRPSGSRPTRRWSPPAGRSTRCAREAVEFWQGDRSAATPASTTAGRTHGWERGLLWP